MKIIVLIICLVLSFFTVSFAEFSKSPTNNPTLLQQGEEKHWCPICGMSLKGFYKTNHAVKLKDGNYKQYCSIRCLAFDYETIKDNIESIKVVDIKSDKFIDAYKAYYVVGSKISGTMSTVSKLGFGKKEDAIEFVKTYGGEIKSFNDTFKLSRESLNNDIAFFIKKKEKMMYPVGEKVYNSVCKPIDFTKYKRINELKAAIKFEKLCGDIDEKKAQAVALYLWEVKRFENNKEAQIVIKNDEKCPVCGMFVYKYPNWAAEIDVENGHFVFDGVKDMMKFYFTPQKYKEGLKQSDFIKIAVTDYYTLKSINGKNAFYVLGSRIYGPMGKELIPFATLNDAKAFMEDYGGSKILRFDEITADIVKSLDE